MRLASNGDVPLLLYSYPGQFRLLSKQLVNSFPDFKRNERVMQCIGVANGIVGLQWDLSHLALWNPATREFKDIPRWPIVPDYKKTQMFGPGIVGLGFDLLSNDFKILGRINTKPDCFVDFHLYSLRADSWKRVKDTPRTYVSFHTENTDVYFNNGVWYWIADECDIRSPVGIVAFNFSSEIFKEFELPAMITMFNGALRLGKYKERLALFACPMLKGDDRCIKIWAATRFCVDDYEVQSSWQLVVEIPKINVVNGFLVKAIFDCGDLLLTICDPNPVTNNGEGGDVYFAEDGAYIYRPSTCTFNYLGSVFRSVYTYLESLFPLSRRLNYN